jgi:hypothetical protein
MRRILISCGLLALVALPAAAAARASAAARPGYLVVRGGLDDGGVNGRPAATIVMKGFVLGRISQEARVDIFSLPLAARQGGVQVKGSDVSARPVRWTSPAGHSFNGKEYTGSNLRFRTTGGPYRVVVRGAGIYLFVGGQGQVRLRGSSLYPKADGRYSVNGGRFLSLPTRPLTLKIGRG